MNELQRVLIVEDQELYARSVREAMTANLGVGAVRIAETVRDAKKAIAEFVPDFVLLDLGLPDGSGFEVMSACDSLPQPPPIVIVTVFDDDEHLFEALRRGAHGYVLKEESGDSLIRLLGDILEGRPPLSPSIARRVLESFAGGGGRPKVDLTPQEDRILRLLSEGRTVADVAAQLEISSHTVQHHVKNLYRKLNVHSRAEMTRAAIDMGLVD